MIVGIYNISPIVTGGVVPSKSQCNQRFILNTDNFLSTFDGVDENSEVFQEYLNETILTHLDKYGYIRGTYTFQTTELIQCYPSECGYVLKSNRQKYFEGENIIDSFQPPNHDKRSETDFTSQKGIEPMHNEEASDPEDPPLLLPQFWSQEEKDGVCKMLQDEDASLKRLAYKIVERWGGFRDWQRNDMSVHETGRDKYGTFVFKVYGGRNYCLSQNAPYYFSQLSTMMMSAKNLGVEIWPLKIKFDAPDDLWDAEFGIAFNKDDNLAWLLLGAKMLDLVEEERVIPKEESATIK